MAKGQEELRQLKEYLIADYIDSDVSEGNIVILSCPLGVAWKNVETGETYDGCGKELVRFIYTGDEEMWSIAADLYLSHLRNTHEYRTPISVIDLTQ